MARLILRQTLEKEVPSGPMCYPSRTFDWRIIPGTYREDKKGTYVRIGSWGANYWFHVSAGKTDKQTLGYAKQHLARTTPVPIKSFEYIEEE